MRLGAFAALLAGVCVLSSCGVQVAASSNSGPAQPVQASTAPSTTRGSPGDQSGQSFAPANPSGTATQTIITGHACSPQYPAACTTVDIGTWQTLLQPASGSIVKISTYSNALASQTESGTGFFADGYLFTCYHVVASAHYYIDVWIPGSQEPLHATIVAIDPAQDLVALTLDSGFNPGNLTLENTGAIASGEAVALEGYPGGGPETINSGNLVSQSETIDVSGYGQLYPMYGVTAQAQPGNSGSPLFDAAGDVIGVVEDSGGGSFTGAIPVAALQQFISQSGL